MEQLFEINNSLIRQVDDKFTRSLAYQINWNSRLIEIRGARGVGKTTMLLQQVKKRHGSGPQTGLYASLDDPYFYSNSIIELAEGFVKYGGEALFLDEVHKYPAKHERSDWSSEIKTVYDRYPDLRIVYTGSSMLGLYKGKGDLSRRRVVYHLQGLSFREYLLFHGHLNHNVLSLKRILTEHETITRQLPTKLKVLRHFHQYLEYGYYPFHLEHKNLISKNKKLYYSQLNDILSLIMEIDIPSVTEITFDKVVKVKKLLAVISTSAPYTPELKRLKQEIGIADDRTLLRYLHYLHESAIVNVIHKASKGNQVFRKPDKLYLENTNLMHALGQRHADAGNIRETFFLNQMKADHAVHVAESGDFQIDQRYVFEIGGKNKQQLQIRNIDHAYIAADDIESGFGNRIPLWLFGFLY